jgi:hypothetical protein
MVMANLAALYVAKFGIGREAFPGVFTALLL